MEIGLAGSEKESGNKSGQTGRSMWASGNLARLMER